MGDIKHIKEFEYFYSLGPDRTYPQVANKFNRQLGTVTSWGTRENWQEEVRLRDKQALELARERAVINKVDTIEDYRKIIKASLSVYIEKLKKGKVDIKTVQDMERLIKLDIDLLNEVEEVVVQPQGVDTQVETVNDEEITGFTFDYYGMPEAERKEKEKAQKGKVGGISET